MPPPPPPPTVTGLQPTSAGPLCPGKTVEFKASTSPTDATVTWAIAVNGGQPQAIQGDGNTLRISGTSGQTIVVTASLTNSRSATAKWKVAELKIDVPPGPNNGRYVITDEPRMPVVTATAVGVGGPVSVSEWEVSVAFTASDCPPFGPHDLRTIFRVSRAGGNEVTTDFFGDVVRGGSISFHAKSVVNGCPLSAYGGAGLVGTNPQQTDIQAALPHNTLRRIACKESGQRQFDAPPNGGTGYCPLFGPDGKVGIMQIANPTDDQLWNWKENVKEGIRLFETNVIDPDDPNYYPSRIRNSEEFKSLVSKFNKTRQQQGLHPIQVALRRFNTGNFDNDLQERELDAIRGYNGYYGPDKFGFNELHEYRVEVDDEGVLVVANINEQTLQGDAVWERVPVADRTGGKGNPNYVEEVLAFTFDCTASTASCNLTGITPNTATLFIVRPGEFTEPSEFTAEGTGLADVKWRAAGGTPSTGTGSTFTTKWLKSGKKTITATCGGKTKTATVRVLQVEIQINTGSTKDDIVQLKSVRPSDTFKVPCKIRLRDATDPLDIVLTSQNDRLGFVGPLGFIGPTMPLKLPKTGDLAFEITGEKASSDIGDAKISVKLGTATGPLVAEKKVTVFSFDEAQILLEKGGDYNLASGVYIPAGVTVSFKARARLRPEGLDCTAPQIKKLRVGIMQEVHFLSARTEFGSPKVEPEPGVHDLEVSVPKTVLIDTDFNSPPPLSDCLPGAAPLYAKFSRALKPPTGCRGAGFATVEDTATPAPPPLSHQCSLPVFNKGVKVGTVTWKKVNFVTVDNRFRTFCVVFDMGTFYTGTKRFSALREATWKLQIDSRKQNQHADVNNDKVASADPTMPPPLANDSFRNSCKPDPAKEFIYIP